MVSVLVAGSALVGCEAPPEDPKRASQSASVLSSANANDEASTPRPQSDFETLRQGLNARCGDCHLAIGDEESLGTFHYIDALVGTRADRPGFFEAAFEMEAALSGESKKMPRADKDPEGSDRLLWLLRSWIAAGRPSGTFDVLNP